MLRNYSYETKHVVVKVAKDTAGNEVLTRRRKMHDFNAFLQRNESRIQSSVDPAVWVIDHTGRKARYQQGLIDVTRLSPIVVNEHEVKPSNDEVYRSACFDLDVMRYELVYVG